MKCVQNIVAKTITRVSDKEAEKMVKSAYFRYVPKSQFKAQQKAVTAKEA